MLKAILPAVFVSLVAVSSASALPLVSPEAAQTESQVTQVQGRPDDARRGNDRREFTPGRRYDRSPPGWRRHGSRRPGDWRTRGCIMVGPVWFCP
jgi:hypothetical protein